MGMANGSPAATDSDLRRLEAAIAGIGVHDHLCLIYRTQEEQFAAVVPFIRIGLERGERCVYIVDDNTAETVVGAIAARGTDVGGALRSGRLAILNKQDAYLKQGYFDPDWMIDFLARAVDEAKGAGFPALRVTGEMTWVLGGEAGTHRLMEYEAKLNYFFPDHDALAICQYNYGRFQPQVIGDVISTHPLVIFGNTVCRNYHYVPPDDFLDRREPEREIARLLEGIRRNEVLEQSLRESEERFKHVFESANVGMSITRPGGDLLVNQFLADLLGYSREELAVRKWQEISHPDDVEPTQTVVDRLLTGEASSARFEKRYLRKDGSVVWADVSTALRRDVAGTALHFVTTVVDITERKHAEAVLRESERRLRSVLDSVSLAALMLDARGSIIFCNDYLLAIAGWTRDEVLGRSWFDLFVPPEIRREIREAVFAEAIAAGKAPSHHQNEILTRSGERRLINWNNTVLRDHAGAVIGVASIGEDITERRSAEEALAQSRAQLLQSQKLQAVGRLAGGVAHDFNNIIQAMLSLATVLHLKAGRPELVRIVDEIEAHIKRGAALTQQLLLFSRRQAGERKRLELGEAASAAAGLLRRLIPENILLAVEDPPEPVWVDANPGQLQQVLMNLVVNARDAMPSGGTLTVRAGGGAGEATVEVVDTGCGMDEATRSHLFEPFFTTKDAGRGTGLGLSVVHGIVEQHGGRVEVESEPGKGSTFRVMLPSMPAPERPAAAPGDDAELPRGQGERVLVVEDEDGAREGLSELLTMLGYGVTALGSAEDALALPDAPAPDLLLTDLMLPGIDGATLAARLRERWTHLRVVLMSGYTEDEAVRRGVDEGSVRFLQKPFDVATLARAVSSTLASPPPSDGTC